jgi:hypothetical protein
VDDSARVKQSGVWWFEKWPRPADNCGLGMVQTSGASMGAVAFNGEGLLCSLLCCGLSVGIVMGGNWMGWIPYRDEPPWFFMVWAQTAAIAALLWDRSEKRLFLSAYWSHFEQVAELRQASLGEEDEM